MNAFKNGRNGLCNSQSSHSSIPTFSAERPSILVIHFTHLHSKTKLCAIRCYFCWAHGNFGKLIISICWHMSSNVDESFGWRQVKAYHVDENPVPKLIDWMWDPNDSPSSSTKNSQPPISNPSSTSSNTHQSSSKMCICWPVIFCHPWLYISLLSVEVLWMELL